MAYYKPDPFDALDHPALRVVRRWAQEMAKTLKDEQSVKALGLEDSCRVLVGELTQIVTGREAACRQVSRKGTRRIPDGRCSLRLPVGISGDRELVDIFLLEVKPWNEDLRSHLDTDQLQDYQHELLTFLTNGREWIVAFKGDVIDAGIVLVDDEDRLSTAEGFDRLSDEVLGRFVTWFTRNLLRFGRFRTDQVKAVLGRLAAEVQEHLRGYFTDHSEARSVQRIVEVFGQLGHFGDHGAPIADFFDVSERDDAYVGHLSEDDIEWCAYQCAQLVVTMLVVKWTEQPGTSSLVMGAADNDAVPPLLSELYFLLVVADDAPLRDFRERLLKPIVDFLSNTEKAVFAEDEAEFILGFLHALDQARYKSAATTGEQTTIMRHLAQGSLRALDEIGYPYDPAQDSAVVMGAGAGDSLKAVVETLARHEPGDGPRTRQQSEARVLKSLLLVEPQMAIAIVLNRRVRNLAHELGADEVPQVVMGSMFGHRPSGFGASSLWKEASRLEKALSEQRDLLARVCSPSKPHAVLVSSPPFSRYQTQLKKLPERDEDEMVFTRLVEKFPSRCAAILYRNTVAHSPEKRRFRQRVENSKEVFSYVNVNEGRQSKIPVPRDRSIFKGAADIKAGVGMFVVASSPSYRGPCRVRVRDLVDENTSGTREGKLALLEQWCDGTVVAPEILIKQNDALRLYGPEVSRYVQWVALDDLFRNWHSGPKVKKPSWVRRTAHVTRLREGSHELVEIQFSPFDRGWIDLDAVDERGDHVVSPAMAQTLHRLAKIPEHLVVASWNRHWDFTKAYMVRGRPPAHHIVESNGKAYDTREMKPHGTDYCHEMGATPEMVALYCLAVLSSGEFGRRFRQEVRSLLRIPRTLSLELFAEGVDLGRQIAWVQQGPDPGAWSDVPAGVSVPPLEIAQPVETGGPLFVDGNWRSHKHKHGEPRSDDPVLPDLGAHVDVKIGEGLTLTRVPAAVLDLQLLGHRVFQRWLWYRAPEKKNKHRVGNPRIELDSRTELRDLQDLVHRIVVLLRLEKRADALVRKILDKPAR